MNFLLVWNRQVFPQALCSDDVFWWRPLIKPNFEYGCYAYFQWRCGDVAIWLWYVTFSMVRVDDVTLTSVAVCWCVHIDGVSCNMAGIFSVNTYSWVIVEIFEILRLLWDVLSFVIAFWFEELMFSVLFCYQSVCVPQSHFIRYKWLHARRFLCFCEGVNVWIISVTFPIF
jgi:hypothetical protein